MSETRVRETVREYYEAWAGGDRERVRALLADDLDFRSPQDRFAGAEAFLECCWQYSEGLTGVEFVRELYEGDRGFVVLRWRTEGGSFYDAEYVRADGGKLREILVVNNSPEFGKLVS